MRIGMIGGGVIGQLLASTWHAHHMYTRTRARIDDWAKQHPHIVIEPSIDALVSHSSLICLCVKPRDYPDVLRALRPIVRPDHIVLLVTSPITIAQLEQCLPCKVAQAIPSITNHMHEGAVLVAYGSRLDEADRDALDTLLRSLGTPVPISPAHVRIAADIASCGPAYVATLIDALVDAAHTRTGMSHATARTLSSLMVRGTGQLLCAGRTPTDVRQSVSVPGGLTAQGTAVLDAIAPTMWDDVLSRTDAAYARECMHLAHVLSTLDNDVDESAFCDDHLLNRSSR
jgi:competence protein ComER